jgi:hypothetical protein
VVARLARPLPHDVTARRLKHFAPGRSHMPTNPILQSIFMYGAIFAIFYFILIRPQSSQRKQHD